MRFRTKAATELSGVPKNRLQQWVFKGIIIPIKESPGHGKAGEYSIDNIVEIMLVEAFYDVGFPLKRAGNMARMISGLDEGKILLSGGRITMKIDVIDYRSEILYQIEELKRGSKNEQI